MPSPVLQQVVNTFAQSIGTTLSPLYAPTMSFGSPPLSDVTSTPQITKLSNHKANGFNKAYGAVKNDMFDEKPLIDFSSGNEAEDDTNSLGFGKFNSIKSMKHSSAPVKLVHHPHQNQHHHTLSNVTPPTSNARKFPYYETDVTDSPKTENNSEGETDEDEVRRVGRMLKRKLVVGPDGQGFYTDAEAEADEEDGGDESEVEGGKNLQRRVGSNETGFGFMTLRDIANLPDKKVLDPSVTPFVAATQQQQPFQETDDEILTAGSGKSQPHPPRSSSLTSPGFTPGWNEDGNVRSVSPGETSGDGEGDDVVYRRQEIRSMETENFTHQNPFATSDSEFSRASPNSFQFSPNRFRMSSLSSTPSFEGKMVGRDIDASSPSSFVEFDSPPTCRSPQQNLEKAREDLQNRLPSPFQQLHQNPSGTFNPNSVPFVPRASRGNSVSSPLRGEIPMSGNDGFIGQVQQTNGNNFQQPPLPITMMPPNGFIPPPVNNFQPNGFGPIPPNSFGFTAAQANGPAVPPYGNGLNNPPFPPRSSSLNQSMPTIQMRNGHQRSSSDSNGSFNASANGQQQNQHSTLTMDQLAAMRVAELNARRPGSRPQNLALDGLPNINATLAQIHQRDASTFSNQPQQFNPDGFGPSQIFENRPLPPQMVPSLSGQLLRGGKSQTFNTSSFGPPPMTSPYSRAEIQAQLDINTGRMPAVPSHMRQYSQPPIPPISPAFSQASTIVPHSNSATPTVNLNPYQSLSNPNLSQGGLSPETIEALVRDPAFAEMLKNFAQSQINGATGTNSNSNSNNNTGNNSSSGSQSGQSQNGSAIPGPSGNNRKAGLFKTELCRSWEEKGTCRYGSKCQFAHGREELKIVNRHPKYKTEVCRTFWLHGSCPYGKRCCFIHTTIPGGASGPPPDPCHLPPGAITEPTMVSLPKKSEEPTSRLHQRMSSQSSSIKSSFGTHLSSYLGDAISSSESSGSSSPTREHLTLDSPSALSDPGLNNLPSNNRVSLDNSDIPSYFANFQSSRSSLPTTPSGSTGHKYSSSFPDDDFLFGASPSKTSAFPKSSPALSWSGSNNNSSTHLPTSSSFDSPKHFWGDIAFPSRKSMGSPSGTFESYRLSTSDNESGRFM